MIESRTEGPGRDAEDHPLDHMITQILERYASKDEAALDDLIPAVQDELRQMAASYFKGERDDHTLQPTALVNEVYIRLAEQDINDVVDRRHFFGIASRLMRQILVDHARARNAQKRGGERARITLSGVDHADDATAFDVLEVSETLERLEAVKPDYARLVELRVFGGLTAAQAGEVLGISRTEVSRRWRTIKAWMTDELERGQG